MIILDIDLDFFLSDIVIGPGRPGRGRPNKRYYKPWTEDQVRCFLEDRCKLSTKHPLPGKVVIEHHEVFVDWREQVLSGKMTTPFTVFHIDAHADLGMGDTAYMYLATELLGKPPNERICPKPHRWKGLCSGNYLLFAMACRWINRLVYVHHPHGGRDVPGHMMKDHDPSSGHIQLKYFGEAATSHEVLSRNSSPIRVEPEVEFVMVPGEVFEAEWPFDVVYLAQSPKYSPITSDFLLKVIGEYINTSKRVNFQRAFVKTL